MRHQLNKSSILEELQIKQERKSQQIEENTKIVIIKERIKREQLALQEKDQELKKISEELQISVANQKKQLCQPMSFQQIQKHQQKYESQKLLKEQERQMKNKQIPAIEFSKSNAYIRLLQQQKYEQEQIMVQRQQTKMRRYLQLKYSEIVNSMYIRPIAKSQHDEATSNYLSQSKSKPVSMHQQSEQDELNNVPLKQVDSYLIKKLEKILNADSDYGRNSVDHIAAKIKHQNPNKIKHNSFQKLLPIPQKTNQSNIQQLGIHLHKKVQQISPNQWKNIFDDSLITQHDKVQQTLEQIKSLNTQAVKLENETIIQFNLEKEEKLNDLLINQIQARLALLENFN